MDNNHFKALKYQPVSKSERLQSMDILRGVALLGILMINIEDFASPWQNLFNPTLSFEFTGSNYMIWFLKQFIFQGKMWALFSILFGAGAYLLITRAENRGKAAGIADIYYRRLFWLLFFALIHGYLIWSGDILYYYAIVGLFLYPIRKLSVRGMLIAVSVLLLISSAISYLDYRDDVLLQKQVTEIEAINIPGKELTKEQQAVMEEWKLKDAMYNPDQETLQKQIRTKSKGTYLEIIKYEKAGVRYGYTDMFYGWLFFVTLMMMILGLALIKAGILSAKSKNRTYLLLMVFGYVIGFSLATFRVQYLLAHNFSTLSRIVSRILWQTEIILVALGHIGLICLFCKSHILGWLKISLAAVGRMAFTNYILQSLIGIFLFYGFGFGLFGTMDKTEQLWVVGAVWLFQLIASPIWLKYFRFGPLEWVWRSLTYWQCQPMIVK